MSMSREDYVGLADVLGDCLSTLYSSTGEARLRLSDVGDQEAAVRYTISRVADHLALENKRFDPERFIAQALERSGQ